MWVFCSWLWVVGVLVMTIYTLLKPPRPTTLRQEWCEFSVVGCGLWGFYPYKNFTREFHIWIIPRGKLTCDFGRFIYEKITCEKISHVKQFTRGFFHLWNTFTHGVFHLWNTFTHGVFHLWYTFTGGVFHIWNDSHVGFIPPMKWRPHPCINMKLKPCNHAMAKSSPRNIVVFHIYPLE